MSNMRPRRRFPYSLPYTRRPSLHCYASPSPDDLAYFRNCRALCYVRASSREQVVDKLNGELVCEVPSGPVIFSYSPEYAHQIHRHTHLRRQSRSFNGLRRVMLRTKATNSMVGRAFSSDLGQVIEALQLYRSADLEHRLCTQ